MSINIIITRQFEKETKRLSKKYASLKSDLKDLFHKIAENPKIGTYIGNNCYKIRLAITSKGKGKSGGARIISYFFIEKETVYLLSIYDKSEKPDLKPNELKEIIQSLELEE